MDWPHLDLQGFRTVVGRRIVVLFVLCALIPTAALAADSYFRVRQELENEAWQRLEQSSRAAGMSVLERLIAAQTELDLVGRAARGPSPGSPPGREWGLLASAVVTGRGAPEPVFGPVFRPPALSAAQQTRITRGETVLAVDRSFSPARVYLARQAPAGGVLWGDVATDSLLGIAAVYAGSGTAQALCVLADGAPLPGCESLPAKLRAELQPGAGAPVSSAQARVALDTAGRNLMATRWTLFLRPRFGAPSWQVIVATPERAGLAPLAPFRRSFAQILLVALAVVLLLSHQQIRQSLRPLERLHASALRLGRHDFGARVDVESHDEFGDVANAFNVMADELGRQFAALDTINRIDRTVLATLDWTRITDELVDKLPEALPADGVALLVCAATDHSQARLEYAPAGQPDRKVVHTVQLQPGQCRKLEELGSRDEVPGAPLAEQLPMLEEPLHELLGGIGSWLALPIGRNGDGRGALVLAARATDAFGEEDRLRAHQLADQLTVVLHSVDLFAEREDLLHGALLALGRAIDAKSSWTAGHSERVATLSVDIARQLGLDDADQDRLYRAGLLHDIGKIAVPRSVLDKPAKPTPEEMEILLNHVIVGVRILEPIHPFADILPIVRDHHERYDGQGYPNGLRGEEIHPLARVLTVADVFDALVSARPYRSAFGPDVVRQMLRDGAGSHFDPAVVDAFLEVMPAIA